MPNHANPSDAELSFPNNRPKTKADTIKQVQLNAIPLNCFQPTAYNLALRTWPRHLWIA